VNKLDPEDPRPSYQQVRDRLRASIAAAVLAPGDQLPTHRALAEEFGVAIETVKRALNELRSEGLIVARQGKGTYVRTEGGPPVDSDAAGELAELRAQLADHASRLDALERRLVES
jgi:DNA-binding GntR family transcriptional regulator